MKPSLAATLTFLGTGTSTGIPIIACDCAVCQSPDPRDQRLRSSVFIETPEWAIVIDTGPDFRQQCLRAEIRGLDAVLITHAHTDHIMGFDDLRRFTFGENESIPVYAAADTMAVLARVYDFAFNGQNRYAGYLKPKPIIVTGAFLLGSTRVTPLPVEHGKVTTVGYHFAFPDGRTLAYLPDCKVVPSATRDALVGCDVLIVDALRHAPHPTHFTLAEALDFAREAEARHTYLTHLSHDLGHAETEATLPKNVRIAYDGLQLKI
jgi:phosphoribosyl 1,2-cyclic phosphate phosphodiesterase